ncbi:unnamed protein product [Oncorhynchus mykiss]|uniref:Uncharacterized protein n=1 Tax=Oncorhynchus mykiss TaxID=8022 RepID=A0A060ZAQ2_ONCMY|nr:unnamed protein product [Oncorhynchus mykiss]
MSFCDLERLKGAFDLFPTQADPKELIRLVTQHVTAHSDWPADVEELIGQLQVYNERLTDLTQAQVLQGLGRGVDVRRFSSDTHYKKQTILGLTETLDDSVWRISLSLAQRYSIPLWDIYMTHLEFLFTDSGLSTKDIEGRVDTLALFDSLKSEPESFHSHMSKYVLTSVEGTDLPRYKHSFILHCLSQWFLILSSGTRPYFTIVLHRQIEVRIVCVSRD